MTPFKNAHLSYSRLSRFEQCPASFKLNYIEKMRAAPGVPLRFGKAIHAVLERLVEEHMREERDGVLSEERAIELWQEAWAAGELTGVQVFEEGLEMLHAFVRRQGVLNHLDVLAVEQRFNLTVGPFNVLGFIDRVDRVDDETIEIIDYKTNRMLFTRDEVNHSLQMSLYHLAARAMWPWAKKVRLTFDMLRHGVRMTTERTEEQLAAARRYVETMGRMTEEATSFPARLNTNCVWCDHKANCPAFAAALKGKREVVCEDLCDLEMVGQEREEVAQLAKVLYARKRELEDVIKSQLKDKDELVLGGMRYRMNLTRAKRYPLMPTLSALAHVSGQGNDTLLTQIASVDKKALDALVKEITKGLGKQKGLMLKAELAAIAEQTPSQRFSARKVL